jgi:hypothetical protein
MGHPIFRVVFVLALRAEIMARHRVVPALTLRPSCRVRVRVVFLVSCVVPHPSCLALGCRSAVVRVEPAGAPQVAAPMGPRPIGVATMDGIAGPPIRRRAVSGGSRWTAGCSVRHEAWGRARQCSVGGGAVGRPPRHLERGKLKEHRTRTAAAALCSRLQMG